MKEQLNLVLPTPPSLTRPWRSLLLHGRVLSVGYLAILLAGLWKILAAVAVAIVFAYAALACIPDLGISPSDASQWYNEWSKTSKIPPAFNQRFTEIAAHREIIFTHFRQIQSENAIFSVCLTVSFAIIFYILALLIWNYVYEGRAEFRISNAEPLLERARAALPMEFPHTRLAISPRTFVRYRLRSGVTTFISSSMLVRLFKGKIKEFQFALLHEAYHLGCFDPLSNSISTSLRRILAVIGACAAAFICLSWIDVGRFARSPLAPAMRLITLIGIFFFVLRRLSRLDLPFLKHKELLADRYAWQSLPNVDLDSVYYRDATDQAHPTTRERIRFLSEGQCTTACAAFLTMQEVVLCCVSLVDFRVFDDAMGTLPRTLEFPSFILAISGSLVLGAEACVYQLPTTDRTPLIRRGFLISLLCLLFAGRTQTPWFPLTIFFINGLVLWRIAR